MKKAVRFLAAAMVVMMLAMALAGCGGSSGNEIVIGGVGPLTGTAATYGQSVRNAAQIAVDADTRRRGHFRLVHSYK